MTPSMVPSLLAGSAPPANAPPGNGQTGTATATGGEATPTAFARLLQAVTAGQGGETAPPTGGTPSLPEEPQTVADLLALLLMLARGVDPEEAPAEVADQPEPIPLLDRPAEAGSTADPSTGVPGEALMAYLLMTQHAPIEAPAPALPDDVLALIEAALAAAPPTGGVAGTMGGPAEVAAAMLSRLVEGLDATAVAKGAAQAASVAGQEMPAATGAEGQSVAPDAGLSAAGAAVAGPEAGATGVPASVTQAAAAATAGEPGAEGSTPVPPVVESSPSEADLGGQSRSDARAEVVAAVTASPSTGADAGNEGHLVAPGVPQVTPDTSRVETVTAARVVNVATLPAEVADTVRLAAFRGDSEVRLVLNPPELGHLDIRIASGEGGLRVTLEASQGSARDLIDRSLVQLQQALEARDLRVERIEVRSADTGRGATDMSGGHQPGGRGDADGRDGRPEWSPVASFSPMTDHAAGATSAATSTASAAGDGRVDVLA